MRIDTRNYISLLFTNNGVHFHILNRTGVTNGDGCAITSYHFKMQPYLTS